MQAIEAMAYPLPEDILTRKLAGDLDGALKLIDIYLSEDRAPVLGPRLLLEKQVIARLPDDYPFARDEALRRAREGIPGFTEAEFDECELRGDIQYVYIAGQKRYFVRFLTSLYKLRPDIAARAGRAGQAADELLDGAIAELRREGELSYRLRLRASLDIDASAFAPDDYCVHLPVPARSAQQSDIAILATSEGLCDVQPEDSSARTVCLRRRLDRPETFFVEYEYLSTVRLFDMGAPAPAAPLYPDAPAPCAEDLSELPGHILFTPYLRALAADICAGESDPLRRARRIYDYVTTRVRYSFMREYFLLPPIAEYAALGLKGDCGVQSLLFITLCRIMGIPARWQSGLSSDLSEAGCHDWAQFYAEGWGWLFADCSYGGAALRDGSRERWDFYFGNLDPFRMVANSRFQAELNPPKRFGRIDPYDNQTGECESSARMLLSGELHSACRVINAQRIER